MQHLPDTPAFRLPRILARLVLLLSAFLVSGCPAKMVGKEIPGDDALKICPARADDQKPHRILDLVAFPVDESTVRLEWTATGDDNKTGTAHSYEVRFATSFIKIKDFDQATLHVQNWVPLPSGARESRTVGGLASGVMYFFALKAVDDAGNPSQMSNAASATVPRDTTPPSPITDLASVPGSAEGTIQLMWTATGDDGIQGVASLYDVRYSTSPITEADFPSASRYPQSWVPLPSGGPESRTLQGLFRGTVFYFAVKAADDANNVSGVSNSPSCTLPQVGLPDRNDVWGTSGSDVFIVGDAGSVLHYDGSAWSSQASGAAVDLRGVCGTSCTDVFAVGSMGTILHYDGSAWSFVPAGIASSFDVNAVWASGPNDVFAAGSSGARWRYDGTAWTFLGMGGSCQGLFDIWGTPDGHVYLAGISGSVLLPDHTAVLVDFDGVSWRWGYPCANTYSHAEGVWGSSSTDLYIVGTRGLIFHCDATGYWRKPPETIGLYAHYTGIWGSGPADVFTTDRSGAIRHFDGTSWSTTYSGSTPLNAVWGSSATDAYAVGDGGVVLHYDGTSWTKVIG